MTMALKMDLAFGKSDRNGESQVWGRRELLQEDLPAAQSSPHYFTSWWLQQKVNDAQ